MRFSDLKKLQDNKIVILIEHDVFVTVKILDSSDKLVDVLVFSIDGGDADIILQGIQVMLNLMSLRS